MIDKLSDTPIVSSDYEKIFSLFIDHEGNPEDLKTLDPNTLNEYVDFLEKVKEYKQKLDEGKAVERNEELWAFIEKYLSEMSYRQDMSERNMLRMKNLKDISYHTYFWLAWKKMPWYDYKYKDKQEFTTKLRDNVDLWLAYAQQELYDLPELKLYNDRWNAISLKFDSGYDGLWIYLESITRAIRTRLEKKQKYFDTWLALLVIKLRYMLEVADANHDWVDKKRLQNMIDTIVDAMKIMQSNSYEELEAKRKKEADQKKLLEYLEENAIDLEQIIALQNTIKQIEAQMKIFSDKDNENKNLVTQLAELQKKLTDLFALFSDDIVPNLQKNKFSKWYTLPDDVVVKIKAWSALLDQKTVKK